METTPVKRRFRFTLRKLLIAVGICGVVLGIATTTFKIVQFKSREHDGQVLIGKFGGVWSLRSARIYAATGKMPTGWFFRTFSNPVEQVNLSSESWPNEELRKKGRQQRLVTDNELADLHRYFPELRSIDLHGTSVSDEGLVHIVKLKGLQEIDLRNTHVTANGIEKLQNALPDSIVRH